jgi:hypothetical protein
MTRQVRQWLSEVANHACTAGPANARSIASNPKRSTRCRPFLFYYRFP